MAIKEQFEAFKFMHLQEVDREASLTNTGKLYLTIISLFFAYLGFKLNSDQFRSILKLPEDSILLGMILYSLIFLFVLGSLALTLWSLFMHNYEDIVDAQELFKKVLVRKCNDDVFFALLITNMNIATKINASVSDRRATKLKFASYSLFCGLVLYCIVFLLSLWNNA